MNFSQQKIKVLMPVLHYYPVIGGLETWTKNIAEGLTFQGIEIFVVTGKVENQPNQENLNGVKISRTSLFPLKNLSYSSPIYILIALPFIFFKSLKIIKKERINLLHCQGFLSGILGYFLNKILNVPYIVTVQSLQGKNFLKKIVYKNAKVCIAASRAISDYFEKIGCKTIEVIPNGISLERFNNLNREQSREKLGLKDEFVIMTVARLEKVKGIKYLVQAAYILSYKLQVPPKESPRLPTGQASFKILIIGEGSERKNLEKLVKKLNLEDKVRFLGQIPNEKIPGYLAAADCFCLPSLKEGFGIAILEAQAAGIPVIASRVGGIPDIIRSEQNGILVEPGDCEGLAKALLKIQSDKDLRDRLVKNGLGNLEQYDWQNIVNKVYLIYQQLI